MFLIQSLSIRNLCMWIEVQRVVDLELSMPSKIEPKNSIKLLTIQSTLSSSSLKVQFQVEEL